MTSLILVVYNAEHTVERALQSIVELDPPPDELVVVDDRSSDASLWKVTEFVRAHATLNYRIAGLLENGGVAAARNHGCSVASGDVLIFADDDDCSVQDRVRLHLDALSDLSGPAVSVVAQQIIRTPAIGINLAHSQPVCDKDCRPPQLQEFAEFVLLGERPPDDRVALALPASSMALNRLALETLGGFDPHLRRVEDVDLILRGLSQQIRLHYNPAVGVIRYMTERPSNTPLADAVAERVLLAKHLALLRKPRSRWIARIRIEARLKYLEGRELSALALTCAVVLFSPIRQGRAALRAFRYRSTLGDGRLSKLWQALTRSGSQE